MQNFFLAFIPIFVAVDALGILPIFISLTENISKKVKRRIIFQSVCTALALAVSFLFLGKALFKFLGILVPDFMIAGGVILFCIAVMDIVRATKTRQINSPDVGAVPIGTPLMVGPAVLTTSLIVVEEYGLVPTLFSILVNVLLAGVIFSASDRIMKILGVAGSRALSKVVSLLLAAIAVMMIRKGIFQLINQYLITGGGNG